MNEKERHSKKPPDSIHFPLAHSVHIPLEIVQVIASFLNDPQELFKLYSSCKTYRTALAGDHLWKNVRIRFDSARILDPPAGLSELKYALLLSSRKCSACGAKRSKIYWTFLKRMCLTCLQSITERVKGNAKAKRFFCVPSLC